MKILLSILISLSVSLGFSQGRGHGGHGHGNGGKGQHKPAVHRGGHHHGKKVVVVHRSPYRPAHVRKFHPVWGPQLVYNRRWVYFPKRQLYWDNWRGHYVFWNGIVWVSQPTAPPGVVVTELHKEPKKELKETEDDVDDVYIGNEEHKKE